MCNECYMTFCPDDCPEKEPDSRPLGRCEKCDGYIYHGDDYVASDSALLCRECAERLDTDSILVICGFSSVIELLAELGVEAPQRRSRR